MKKQSSGKPGKIDRLDIDEHVNIFINSPDGLGYGYIFVNDKGDYEACMYQNRLRTDIPDEKADQELAEHSKMYINSTATLTGAVNIVLDFWLKKLGKAGIEFTAGIETYRDAYETLKRTGKDFILVKESEDPAKNLDMHFGGPVFG